MLAALEKTVSVEAVPIMQSLELYNFAGINSPGYLKRITNY